MELNDLLKSRVHRILRGLPSFRSTADATVALPDGYEGHRLADGEQVLGLYTNTADDHREDILVTTHGLHLGPSGQTKFIAYQQISHVDTLQPKHPLSTLRLHLESGEVMDLPIAGGHDRFRDAWEFMRYLDRVTRDIRLKDAGSSSTG